MLALDDRAAKRASSVSGEGGGATGDDNMCVQRSEGLVESTRRALLLRGVRGERVGSNCEVKLGRSESAAMRSSETLERLRGVFERLCRW